ncbi:dienelactone hydrolase family protein [Frankia sp. Ag45/Mut15]|uniref:Dienelactone hydrolase family protein n=2 Tax=Frankia umida TaxID=573489 RepID=A0ABT0K1T4_9ACTN|nr:dienelactone hydrolase family protein [Frankia umida]
MRTQEIEYSYEDLRLIGEFAVDDARDDGPRPGVLVCHGGGGLTDHTRDWTRRLAAAGYAAFALDYYGGGGRSDTERSGDRYAGLLATPERQRALARAGLDVLLARPEVASGQVAAIGFCFGGTIALELARAGADLRAVVGFHAGLATRQPARPGAITGRVLVCLGAEDPIVPADQRLAFEQEMRTAEADWELRLYGGAEHGFTDPITDGIIPGVRYDQRTADRAWTAMINLFTEVFETRP